MALTIAEMAAGMKDQVMAGIILQYARASQLFQKISFEATDSFTIKTWQNKSVTDAVFRDIGSPYTETKDKFSELNEGIYLLGGSIDVDRALRLPGQREIDAWAENLLLQSKRYQYGFTNTFINGDRDVNPDRFDGIKKRVEAAFVAGGVGLDQVIEAAGLDISSSSANRQTFLDHLETAMYEVDEGQVDLILTSKKGRFALGRVARREGLLDTTKDQFDKTVPLFRGMPFEEAGTTGDQTTQIITSTETNAGASTGGTATSFYFIRFDKQHIQGWQMHEPRRIYDDIINDGVTHRTVFEWPVGLSSFAIKSVVRLRGVVPI
ncbi:hypothetical protein LCGC14_0364110 [marine sediment metagenome]|uniref:Bacteriophage Mu GpT domain-containing protein n=1 Tax=marine sediment metagenome TaxID=412755 RepID=A0A0F9TQ44_9ZZZZ